MALCTARSIPTNPLRYESCYHRGQEALPCRASLSHCREGGTSTRQYGEQRAAPHTSTSGSHATQSRTPALESTRRIRLAQRLRAILSAQAEWEKRDPRWIVKDRDDGTNVNHWHWNEKNLLPWSRQRIAELVSGVSADLHATLGSASITGVRELTGEVSAEGPLHAPAICPHLVSWVAGTICHAARRHPDWCSCTQAYLTVRKQNKKFAVFDLNILLTWEGVWVEDGEKVRMRQPLLACRHVRLCSAHRAWLDAAHACAAVASGGGRCAGA